MRAQVSLRRPRPAMGCAPSGGSGGTAINDNDNCYCYY